MKPKEIQELIDFISKSGLDEVNIETGEFKLHVKKNSTKPAALTEPVQQLSSPKYDRPVVASTEGEKVPSVPTPAIPKVDKLLSIKSPMIGTFYNSSNPETAPFVKVGDRVAVGQTVCIIEAMKLFNEIESEIAGVIVKVLVDNATPVEYDQPLFIVEPN